tara:strand:- start:4963 stop:5166 length:204 start_codon:yes stop_codon:yes gene_type:complete
MSNNEDKLKAQHDSDQAWAYMRRFYADIDRIANGGIDDTEEDKLLVQKLAQLVRGEMTLRILDAEGQ